MIAQHENQIIALLQTIFDHLGWLGVAGMMAFENATGIMPSEVILGLAGWMLLAARAAPAINPAGAYMPEPVVIAARAHRSATPARAPRKVS